MESLASDTLVAARTSRVRVVTAACMGNLLEWYDFAVYGALATVLARVFFPASNEGTALLAVFAVYATAFVVRPLGALVFGRLGDLRSRQGTLVTVIALMTAASAGVGLLPGYAVIGLLAPVALVLLRAVQGFAAGGELGVSAVFLVENALPRRRGVYGAWHTATMSVGTALALAVGAALTAGLEHDQIAEGWWRAAFLAALPLGLVAFYLRRSMQVALASEHGAGTAPRPGRLGREHRRAILVGFAHAAPPALCFNLFFIFLPHRIAADQQLRLAPALACAVCGLVTVAVASLAAGRLGDRIGRRWVVVPSSVALAVLAVPLMLMATSGSLLGLALAEIVAGALIGGSLSVALLAELAPRGVRARALAVSAGLSSALVGGTAPIIAQLAVLGTGSMLLPGVYLAVLALVAAAAVAATPETAFRSFD
jgi:MHS family proline/betaine transporter-like MFS transporter